MPQYKVITLIFAFRNRDESRVLRCMNSLARQTIREFEVIFVDYGSDNTISENIKRLFDQFEFVHYIYSETRGMPWNKAHALNTGIMHAETEYILTTDIDLVYSPGFIETFIANLDHQTELHSNAFALPRKFNNWDKLKAPNAKLKFHKRNLTALGLAQGVNTEIARNIGGLDEYYRIWGVEDYDFQMRLKYEGLTTKWLNLEETPVFHQWHPDSGSRTLERIPRGWQKYMMAYCETMKEVPIRNTGRRWGEIYTLEQRPALVHLLDGSVDFEQINDIPAMALGNLLSQKLDKANEGQLALLEISDSKYSSIKGSRLQKFMNRFNWLSDRFRWPVLFQSDMAFYGHYSSVFDYRDSFMYWLLANESRLIDYAFDLTEKAVRIVMIKR